MPLTDQPFRVVHTHHSDRPGSSQTLETASGFEVHGMTTGYGELAVNVYRPDGRIAANICWADGQTEFAAAWAKRRPKFPADVHAAICFLFPFMEDLP